MHDPKKTEFDFQLSKGFSYSHQGDQTEASFVRLTAPTSRHSRECAALKQAFFRAQNSFQGQVESSGAEAPDEEIAGHEVILMIAASTAVDLPDVLDVARKLFSSGIAMVDGETKLTGGLMDRMDQDDFELMLGEYLVNFTLASSLERMKEKSSPAS